MILFYTDQDPELNPFDECALKETKERVALFLNTLTDQQRYIINELFFEGRTQSDIAAELCVTNAHVRNVKENVLQKLRHPTRIYKLKGLLP